MSETQPVAVSQTGKSEHRAPSPTDAEIKELLKDLPFFGACGFGVGWLMLAQYRLTQNGMGPKDSLAEAFISGLMSLNAFGLVFHGLLALGSAVSCLAALNVRWPRPEGVVDYPQVRLAQLASSIMR